jgi:hypothetical protein
MIAEAKQHKKSVDTIFLFATGIARLVEICKEIDELRALQEKDNKGVANNKSLAKDNLVIMLVDVSGALQAYTLVHNDPTLYERINLSENQIENLNQSKLDTFASIVISEAEKLPVER